MASSQVQRKRKRQKKGDEDTLLTELKTLGKDLLSSSSDINNLPRLLSFIDSAYPPHIVVEALLSIQSFFIPLLPKLSSSSSSAAEDTAESVYRTWLRAKFDVFLRSLMSLAISSQADETLREVAVDTVMEFVKVGNAGKFHSYVYHKFVHTIVHSTLESNDMLLQLLASKYFQYIDVRYFTYISLVKIARNLEVADLADNKDPSVVTGKGKQFTPSMELSIHKMHKLLSSIPPFEVSNENSDFEMWNGLGLFPTIADDENHSEKKTKKRKQKIKIPQKDQSSIVRKKMKLKFSKAWLSFLTLPLPLDVYKEVLASLHQSVVPHLSNPLLLCDFLTRSYDIGGVVSVMALSSLYILMTQHGLEYANFYEKLYALLEPSVFVAKYRGKFFQLIDSCLKSPLLPAYLAAAFCKRLSRLALSVPPSGALIIIALVHNLLRRHPSINFLVHWEDNDATAQDQDASGLDTIEGNGACSFTKDDASRKLAGVDYFNDEETDLVKTNATRSSLWEIDTLRHHYCPAVSRFVLSLENDLTLRAKTTEVPVQDFSSGSYATIFGEEIRRRVKQVPLAFYKASPSCLFSEADFPGWTFKSEEPQSVAEIKAA